MNNYDANLLSKFQANVLSSFSLLKVVKINTFLDLENLSPLRLSDAK